MRKKSTNEDYKFYFHKNGKFYPNKLEPIVELLFLTKGKCLMSFLEETNRDLDPMTYHHMIEERRGGPKTYFNGAPLLYDYHGFLNAVYDNDIDLYEKLNYSFDYIKEVFELDEAFKETFTEEEIKEGLDTYDDMDTELDYYDIDETFELNQSSLQQAVGVRRALIIYKEEVIPQINALKEKYEQEGLYINKILQKANNKNSSN